MDESSQMVPSSRVKGVAPLPLLQGFGIARVRLYDPEPGVLRAFAKTGIELYVGVPDQCLAAVAEPAGATSWLKDSILPYLPDTKIVALTVGNEVLTGNDTALTRNLLPAMESLHGALAAANLDKQIAVTTAHNLGVLGTSYPPSAGAFRKDLLQYLCPILDFHAKTGSPFLVNAYPYFAYSDDPKGIHLDYALLEPSNPGVPDANTGLHYPNLLVAQVDAAYHAISAANSAAARTVEIRISETGWPSAGDANEKAATPESAARYNSNVMRLVAEWKGTPLKPNVPLRVYVFALFNENMKPGPASERNYGLFKPDSTPVYPLTYKPARGDFTPGGNSTGGDNGYYDISAASREPTIQILAIVISKIRCDPSVTIDQILVSPLSRNSTSFSGFKKTAHFPCGNKKGFQNKQVDLVTPARDSRSGVLTSCYLIVKMPNARLESNEVSGRVAGGHGCKLLWQEVRLLPSWSQPEVLRSSWSVPLSS
ncbi:Glucan endo-1,3-beta-glucosidase 11 [Triticum urartu]|uniref:glucan endo-1,3-beta-D-glucosidase n=1 Tax=Triticum urartu TaxID=4572 RepID=M8A6Z0_TRIUA|nr:Glucan endo-1,3-beta-glucosidase 11 [Triticum urartu]